MGVRFLRELKYAILGLVNRDALSGYDITKAFSDSLSKFWEAKHSQIYPELRRLMDEGLVEYTVAIHGEKLEKKLYTITSKGRDELIQWLTTPEPLEPVPKDAFRLKIYFGENLEQNQMEEVLKGQLKEYQARLAILETSFATFAENPPEKFTPEFSEYLLIKGGIFRDNAYINWLRECAELLEFNID